ncbi:MAG TPA: hypothetical protein VGH27_29505 [Streptosporangiaceae bacterium]
MSPLWRDQDASAHPGGPGKPGGGGSRGRRRALVAGAVAVTAAAATAVAFALSGSPAAHPAAAQGTAPHQGTSKHVSKPAAGSHAAASGTLLATGQQGTSAQVPWSQVGPGWMLAAWNPDKPSGVKSPEGFEEQEPTPTTVFLVDPAGGRYAVDTLPAQAPSSTQPDNVLAWSGNGQRALLGNASSPNVSVVNLPAGAASEFSLGAGVSPLGFTAPDGLAILANAGGANGDRPKLERFSLTGQLEHVYPSTFAGGRYYNGSAAVESPDGTQIALSTSGPIELMSNDGQLIRSLPVSASASSCAPLRWWNSTGLLAQCMPASPGTERLWLVPVSGAAATALTSATHAQGDIGDLNAWPLASGTYVQVAGGCGYVYVAKLQPNAQTAPVPVPGVPSGDSTIVLGSNGNDLAVQAVGACGGLSSLMWFNPAAGSVTPLLGGSANGGYTGGAVLFGEPRNGLS